MTLKNKLYIIIPVVVSLVLIAIFSALSGNFQIIPKSPDDGTGLPEIEFRLPNGQNSSLKDLRGSALLLNFWAAWCEPCLEEMPSLRALEKLYKHKGLTILAINIEDVSLEDVQAKLVDIKLPQNLIFNVNRSQLSAYKLEGIPVSILIDKKGTVKKVFEGPRDWDSPEMLRQLDKLLQE